MDEVPWQAEGPAFTPAQHMIHLAMLPMAYVVRSGYALTMSHDHHATISKHRMEPVISYFLLIVLLLLQGPLVG